MPFGNKMLEMVAEPFETAYRSPSARIRFTWRELLSSATTSAREGWNRRRFAEVLRIVADLYELSADRDARFLIGNPSAPELLGGGRVGCTVAIETIRGTRAEADRALEVLEELVARYA